VPLVTFYPFLLSIALNIHCELYEIRSKNIEAAHAVACWRVNYAFVEKEEQTKKEKA